jgi:murein DD-endopeptidase MepM/ murein hydrolase activator NlpD
MGVMNSLNLKTKKMIKELKKISAISLLGISLFFIPLTTQAENTSLEGTNTQVTRVKSEPVLLADRANPGFEIIAVDSILLQMSLRMEAVFLAEELYEDNWNTEFVKAYSHTQVPDSFTIDVSTFVMPVESHVTSHYGPRRRRFHYGTDFKVQIGDTIRAAFDGKVRVKRYERRGYGYFIVLRHSNGLETVYGHLSNFLVEQDEEVKAGQPIGLGGNTGRSTGSHLHFEFRFLGQAINPGEIIDFAEFTAKDNRYVFLKNKSGQATNKYLAQGDGQVKYYRIKQGDTLGAIARRNRTTVAHLCKINNIKPSAVLRVGRSIRIS